MNGRLGHSTLEDEPQPRAIESLKGIKIRSAQCGDKHTLLLSHRGDVLSFGCGVGGRLGLDDEGDVNTPSIVMKFREKSEKIEFIAAG